MLGTLSLKHLALTACCPLFLSAHSGTRKGGQSCREGCSTRPSLCRLPSRLLSGREALRQAPASAELFGLADQDAVAEDDAAVGRDEAVGGDQPISRDEPVRGDEAVSSNQPVGRD